MEPSAKSEPSTNTSPTSIPIISATFCDPEADITFKSSDSVLFKIHRKYLEATSAGFTAPPFVETDHEVVLLQEPCEVLEILFRFIHPPTESQQYRQPAMMGVKADVLFAVAEAAEKYLVFGAMNICLSRMDKIAEERPLEILNHCYKHGYDELADQVALHTIAFRLPVVAAKLTYPGLLQKWLVYYDHWMDLSRFTRGFIQKSSYGSCGKVMSWEIAFLNKFADYPLCVISPPPLPSTPTCPYSGGCHIKDMSTLFSELARRGNAIPKFMSIQIV